MGRPKGSKNKPKSNVIEEISKEVDKTAEENIVVKTTSSSIKNETGPGALCSYKDKKYWISQNPLKENKPFTLWDITSDEINPIKIISANSPTEIYNIIYKDYIHEMTTSNSLEDNSNSECIDNSEGDRT